MVAHIWFIMEVYIKKFLKVPWKEVVLEFSSGKKKRLQEIKKIKQS